MLLGALLSLLPTAVQPATVADVVTATVPVGNITGGPFRDFTRWRSALTSLYAGRGNAPLWFDQARARPVVLSLLQEIEAAQARGLDPADYDAAELRGLIATAERAGDSPPLLRADLALSATAARLAADLGRGRIDPRRLGYELDLMRSTPDIAADVLAVAQATDLRAQLDRLEPQLRHYALLKSALARYRSLAVQEGSGVAELGFDSRSRRITNEPALRARLLALGDIPVQVESLVPVDEELLYATARFQRRHGLPADGVPGRATYAALTVPLRNRLQQIELSMERMRWLPRTFDEPPIIVNIPQFRLFAFEGMQDAAADILGMDVIVGSSFAGRRTPVFAARLRYVVLHPYWDVPASILRKELLPDILADHGFVARNHYEIVRGAGDDAKPLPVTAQTVQQLADGQLRLRQAPGDGNALGVVKFMFPNRHNVYLHDTPARTLFGRSRRSLSHGCIRVSDPLALLGHVLHGEPGWSPQRIDAALQDSRTQRIALTHAMPVFIVYGTALVTEAGEVLFFDDIYGQDAPLLRALSARHSARYP
jgi:murein L,D-transpeptidase YcbB/YkuD